MLNTAYSLLPRDCFSPNFYGNCKQWNWEAQYADILISPGPSSYSSLFANL